MTKSALKKVTLILSIALIVILLAQFAVMCLPYFELTPVATRKNPNPVPTKYSLQNYAWTDCEEMSKVFDNKKSDVYIKDYDINDYAVDFALVDVFIIVAVIMLLMEIKHMLSKYKLIGSGAWSVLSHIFCLLSGGYTVYVFLTNGILQYGYNQIVCYLSMGVAGVALVVELARLGVAFANRTRYKIVQPTKD